MFKRLQVKNFKGLSELEINDMSFVNLIGGRNNVGKTSLLEALFLFHDRINPSMFLRLHGWRGFQSVVLTPDTMWAPIFSNYDLECPIEINVESIGGEKSQFTIKINNKFVRAKIQDSLAQPFKPRQIKTDTKASITVALDLIYKYGKTKEQIAHLLIDSGSIEMQVDHFDYMNVKSNEAVFIASSSRINPQEDAERFGKLDLIGKQTEIIEFIRQTIEPRLISLSSIAFENQSILHAQLEGFNRKIPISYMGDGMARLISIILAISTCKNGIVFIDEIENGIHYSVLPKIWLGLVAASQKYNCQIFATTHSYECLDAAIKGIDATLSNNFKYIRLEREKNKSISNTYSYEELSTSIEHGWEVR